jgi:nucleoid DNA-binding protein
MAQAAQGKKGLTKSQLLAELAEGTGLTKQQVAAVLDQLPGIVQREIGKKGPGMFTLPGLLKIITVHKPATKKGQKPNPFKPGEMMEVKAKPARRVVKVRPLKGLKDMA